MNTFVTVSGKDDFRLLTSMAEMREVAKNFGIEEQYNFQMLRNFNGADRLDNEEIVRVCQSCLNTALRSVGKRMEPYIGEPGAPTVVYEIVDLDYDDEDSGAMLVAYFVFALGVSVCGIAYLIWSWFFGS